MNEEKEREPDGFPKENDIRHDSHDSKSYNCDCCGKEMQFGTGFRVDALVDTGQECYFHYYSFCDDNCAEEFAKKYGLIMDKTTDKENEDGVETSYTFRLADPVAAAVKSINVGGVSTDGATDDSANEEATEELEPVPEELVQATLAAEDERQETGLHERKVLQVWDRVVSNAQEIAQLASEIEEKNNELKALKKDYEALVKRQNTYILQNDDGIQTTFADLDSPADPQPDTDVKPDAEAVDADTDAEAVDALAWRDEPVTVLTNYGLTEKQADKTQEAFGTLGRLQDWLCADYRDKQPGIGQALQDKLTDALNKYTETVYAEAKADAEATEPEE